MDGDFARLGAEHVALNANEVADVEQLFEHHVVEVLVFAGAQLIAVDVNLNAAAGILQLHE